MQCLFQLGLVTGTSMPGVFGCLTDFVSSTLPSWKSPGLGVCVCTCACMHPCAHTHTHACIHVHTRTHTHMYICTHVTHTHTYTHTQVCARTHTHTREGHHLQSWNGFVSPLEEAIDGCWHRLHGRDVVACNRSMLVAPSKIMH